MYGGTIPLTFAPKSFGDSVLLVGDAAGQVKPFSGGGIYTSLVGAATPRSRPPCLRERRLQRDVALALREVVEARDRRRATKSLRLRNFGLSLDDGDVDRVVQALRSPGLQDLAAQHADIDYPSRVLLRLARSLPALGVLAGTVARKPAAALGLARAHLPFAL